MVRVRNLAAEVVEAQTGTTARDAQSVYRNCGEVGKWRMASQTMGSQIAIMDEEQHW